MVEVFPYQIHTVLTDNGMAFAACPSIAMAQAALLEAISSAGSVTDTTSSMGSPSRIILGPMAKPSG